MEEVCQVGVPPTFRKFCTLREFQPKKVEFLYTKEPTFLDWLSQL